jgi:nucleotide-binding universal stress UspA family protein
MSTPISRVSSNARRDPDSPTTAVEGIARSVELDNPVLLVASDGGRPAGAALRVADALARSDGRIVELLVVVDRMSLGIPEGMLTHAELAADSMIDGTTVGQVRRQLRAIPSSGGWTVQLEFGRAAPTIARVARERGAGLVVLGLGKHTPLTRLFGAETVLRVLRLSDVPLLAVHPQARQRPRTIVAAIDFGRSSVRAARIARRLVATPGTLHLVHVRPPFEYRPVGSEGWEKIYAEGVRDAFEKLVRELEPSDQVRITTEVVRGGVAESLLDAAAAHGADLIATGSHSHPLVDRLLIGMTPTVLIRAAATSVLVAPPETDEKV